MDSPVLGSPPQRTNDPQDAVDGAFLEQILLEFGHGATDGPKGKPEDDEPKQGPQKCPKNEVIHVPVYDYKCQKCNRTQDEVRTVDNRHDCPKCSSCGSPTEKVISAPSMVIPDIQPYRAMAGDRRMVNSRVQHRQFLREFKLEEIGNEGPPPSVQDGRAYVPKRKRRAATH